MGQNMNKEKKSSVGKWIALAISIVVVMAVAAFFIWNGGLPYISNDVNTYGDTSHYRAYSNLELFPDESEKGELEKYYVYFAETMFDPTVVLYAECQYEETDYWSEIERIKTAQSEYGNEMLIPKYDEDNYTLPAYVMMEDKNECYEYALLEEDSFTVRYVYLQFANKLITNFSKDYLPEDF